MKCRIRKFPLIHLLLLFFHSSFVIKNEFYNENIHNAYNFYRTDLYVNLCSGVFRTPLNIYGGASLQKAQKSFIVDD